MKYILLIVMSVVLTACGIGGHWMEGNPVLDRNITPYLHHWFKENVTMEERRTDSRACGSAVTIPTGDFIAFSDEQYLAEKNQRRKMILLQGVGLKKNGESA